MARRRARGRQPRARLRGGLRVLRRSAGDARNDGWGEYPDPGVQPPQRDLGTETHYEYGSRAGVWRLARIYDDFGVPVTVSAARSALELNPAVAAWMRERGHDLLGHGWRWTEPWTQSREEEREHLLRAIATFERVLGERPLGWNSRSFPSEHTRELLVEEGGFLYDSDPSNDDLPYWTTCLGEPVLIVPYTKTYQDARYLVTPGLLEPARLPRHAGHGPRPAARGGPARVHDGRRARALVGAGGAGGGDPDVPRARDGAAGGAVHAPARRGAVVGGAVPASGF